MTRANLAIMTFNTWCNGEASGQPLSQTAAVIDAAQADVVGLQEASRCAKPVADLLGWDCVVLRHGAVVSRFDIVDTIGDGFGVSVRTPAGDVDLFNIHLPPSPYQPYQLLGIPYGDAPFVIGGAAAIESARAARGEAAQQVLDAIATRTHAGRPTFVTGDFNEPSHLDWTAAAATAGHHPLKVAWPTSQAFADAGFRDASRTLFPSEVQKPGFTWCTLTQRDDPADHHDRIDWVLYRGDVKPVATRVIGEHADNADVVVSPYPSDHRAVVAVFEYAT